MRNFVRSSKAPAITSLSQEGERQRKLILIHLKTSFWLQQSQRSHQTDLMIILTKKCLRRVKSSRSSLKKLKKTNASEIRVNREISAVLQLSIAAQKSCKIIMLIVYSTTSQHKEHMECSPNSQLQAFKKAVV